jgi:hypothetical protein
MLPCLCVIPSLSEFIHSNSNSQLAFPVIGCLLFFTLSTTVTAAFVTFARRHLMVWRVFAPKYICDGLIMLAADVALLGGCAMAYRLRDAIVTHNSNGE